MEHHDDLLPIGDRGDPGDPAAMLASMSDDEVEQALLGLRRHLNVTSIWLHHAVAEYDRRGVAERRYVLTTRQWLRRFCRMSGTTASRLSNLTLLCRRHHTAVHEGRRSHRWAASTVPDRRPEPPDP